MLAFGAPSLPARFWNKVEPEPNTGCWLWSGHVGRNGYGQINVCRRAEYAHRVAYEGLVDRIPAGLTIDHLCRVPSCVNPAHLEPVSMKVNLQRGGGIGAQYAQRSECSRGHTLRAVPHPKRARECLLCANERERARYAQKKGQS